MSSFIANKLDKPQGTLDTLHMKSTAKSNTGSRRAAGLVRQRIQRGGERLWRLEDFRDLPIPAVARSLSRLAQTGLIERISKGTYFRTRQTAFGKSRPNPTAIQRLVSRHTPMFPSGLAAASVLGFTTQTASRSELATSASSLPRKLIGESAIVRTRRPEAWSTLSETDAAILEFLRRAGSTSELSPNATVRRTLVLLGKRGRYARLVAIAGTEPPRVRALLGALGQQMGRSTKALAGLHDSLNPLSRYCFGLFSALPSAKLWHAKRHR